MKSDLRANVSFISWGSWFPWGSLPDTDSHQLIQSPLSHIQYVTQCRKTQWVWWITYRRSFTCWALLNERHLYLDKPEVPQTHCFHAVFQSFPTYWRTWRSRKARKSLQSSGGRKKITSTVINRISRRFQSDVSGYLLSPLQTLWDPSRRENPADNNNAVMSNTQMVLLAALTKRLWRDVSYRYSRKTGHAALSRKTDLTLLPFAALGNRGKQQYSSFIFFLHLSALLLGYAAAMTVNI